MGTYDLPLKIPVWGIVSYISFASMKSRLPHMAQDVKVVGVEDSGHYLNEEKPEVVINAVKDFLKVNEQN